MEGKVVGGLGRGVDAQGSSLRRGYAKMAPPPYAPGTAETVGCMYAMRECHTKSKKEMLRVGISHGGFVRVRMRPPRARLATCRSALRHV